VNDVLRIADGVTLPADYVTKTAAICAQRRKGKTYTASVIAEELVRLGHPWVAFDPTSAWWGLRAGADGKSEGLPVVIIGGDHGDLPLEGGAGRLVADLVVDHPGWYVIDLSLLGTRAAERTFAFDFADRLYRRKSAAAHRFPMHFFVDEADLFAPQDKEAGDNKMLGAFQAIVRRAGILGLGCTLITQRPALLNKSVLTQLDLLILLRLVAGNDQDAVDKNYIQRAGSKEQRAELMGSLASLAVGEAWLWEPGADPALFARTRIRERHTFNSSATPKMGETTVEPTRLADVDLAAIKEQMADTIEKAKADDPKELRKQIRRLEGDVAALRRELEERPAERVVEVQVESTEIPVLDEQLVIRLEEALSPATGLLAEVQERLAWQVTQHDEVLEFTRKLADRHQPPAPDRPGRAAQVTSSAVVPRERDRAASPERVRPARANTDDDVKLGKAEKSVLTVLARFPDGRNKRQLAALAGLKSSGGHFSNTLSRLRTAGRITGEGEGIYRITDDGQDALGGDVEPLPQGEALLHWWMNQLGKTHRAVLQVLVDAYPSDVGRAELADAVGVDAGGGHFGNILSQLRTRDLITGKGELRADDDFMAAIR
jgi:uncharacterized protein